MTDSGSAQVAPSRRWLGILALVLSLIPFGITIVTVVVVVSALVAPSEGSGWAGVNALFYALMALLPGLIALGVSIWAIARSRPRWWGVVALVLSVTPMIYLVVVAVYMVVMTLIYGAGA
ncbi:hypothetical protein J2Y69_002796 [Microbacterium resistens]|uniref:Integral membrane protein n=1 Tax=Microbacterium resistens TaxID=156977 RepID=A0ABU1SF19_9MICO|nr:hypothetical protein [Microbacterium resistens]MDR6868185.1 hypothetical protein [Microbacterium resistens]